MKFLDRHDAGRRLAKALSGYKGQAGVVLAIPRGGVPVGAAIAMELGWPLELLLSKKIGHPQNPEYAIGAVGLTDTWMGDHPDIPQDYIMREIGRVREQLEVYRRKYAADAKPHPVKGVTVVIADDGIATGSTLLNTIPMIRRRHPGRIVVAAPVSSKSAMMAIRKCADEVVVLHCPDGFTGIGAFYEDFHQLDDGEVRNCIEAADIAYRDSGGLQERATHGKAS